MTHKKESKSDPRSLHVLRNTASKTLAELERRSDLSEGFQDLLDTLTAYHDALDDRELSLQTALVNLVDNMSQTNRTLAATHDSLSETGMRLEGILDAAHDTAFIITEAGSFGKIIEFSAGAEKMFGYTKREVIGETAAILCPPAGEHLNAECTYNSIVAIGSDRSILGRKSGATFPAQRSSYPLMNEAGKTTSILTIVNDLSMREMADKLLKETNERYRALAKATPVSIMAFDENGTVTFVNDWHMLTLDKGRIQPELYLGKKLFDLPGIVRAGLTEKLRQVLKGKSFSAEDVYTPAFGIRSESWQNFRSSPLELDGQIKGGIIIREDVTRRKQTEQDLKMLIDSSPIPLLKVELVGTEHIIRYLNPEAIAMFGHGALNKSVDDYILAVEDDAALAAMRGERCTAMTKNGPRQAIRSTHQPSGRFEIMAVMDVSVLISAKESAEESSRVKSNFLANISHEIRTPLNVLLGMLQLFQEHDLGEEMNEMAGYATGAARSLLALLNDILDFSIIEAHALALDEHPFNLAELIELVITPYRMEATRKGLALHVSIDSKLPTLITGDARRIRQVFFHLLGNAVKFTDAGSVTVEVAFMDHLIKNNRTTVAIMVSDTGIGISEKQMSHIFEPFHQADGSRTRRHGGTGIGLALVNEFITAMSGTIAIFSEPGVGTDFLFTIDVGIA